MENFSILWAVDFSFPHIMLEIRKIMFNFAAVFRYNRKTIVKRCKQKHRP